MTFHHDDPAPSSAPESTSSDRTRFVRRNRVDERRAVAIAVVGGLVAATAGARPTGSTAVDVTMVALFGGLVVWASASAPWWAVTAAAGIAAVTAVDPAWTAVGAAGFLLGLWIGVRKRDLPEMRAVVGAVAVNVLARSDLDGFLGLSALVAIATCVALFVAGIARRPRVIRRGVVIGAGVLAVLAIGALAGAAFAGLDASDDVRSGNQLARDGIAALNDGDYAGAAQRFDDSARSFAAADRALGGPLATPALLIPAVAQNLSAGADISAAAADTMTQAADALRQIDPSTLRLVSGALDLDAVAAVEPPLVQVQDALVSLRATADSVRSPWLVDRVQAELDDLDDEFADNEPRLQNAIDAVRLAPAMLGGDGDRTYMVLFTSPAEARGVGGFVGNYAIVTASNGRITVDEFGRRSDLQEVLASGPGAECTDCPQELLDRYGRYGFTSGPNGGVAPAVWQNITMPAHFPHVGAAAQALLPQSGGPDIDGVILMDPYVIETLMRYTGPIEVPELGVTVDPDDAAEFILREQYILAGDGANDERIEASGTLGETAITRLLAGTLPQPADLARDFAPLVDERRLLLWTDRPDEQDLLARTGLLGDLPALDADDGGFSMSVTNAGGNKIDVFLDRDVAVSTTTSPDGTRQMVADVTLTNNAPGSGLPQYVIGNLVGLPSGSSRLIVSFYGPPTLTSATRNGEPRALESFTEAGWTGLADLVDLDPGESVTYQLVFDLPPAAGDADDREPVTWEQPLANR
jgi:hypothetical protein